MSIVKFHACLFFLILTMTSQAVAECQEETIETFKARQEHQVQLVFFASWCLSCKEHLETLRSAKNTLFIATFDRKDKANDVLKFLKMENASCIFDRDGTFSEYFGVTELPAIKTFPKVL